MNSVSERSDTLFEQIDAGCKQAGLNIGTSEILKLTGFLVNLAKWNQAYNLTAIRDLDEMVVKHILDSLVVLPYLSGKTFLDVGTGPGLPGIPLAICDKTKHWTLIDSNGKKTRFLLQMKAELALSNVTVIKGRIEALNPETRYDMITSRAFSSLTHFVEVCCSLLKPEGELMALKGQIPVGEIEQLDRSKYQITIESLSVPHLSEARNLVRVKSMKNGSTQP